MNAAISRARSRALDAVSHLSTSSSNRPLPTTTTPWSASTGSHKSKPRLFTRPAANHAHTHADAHAHADADGRRWWRLETPSRSMVVFVLGCIAWYMCSSLSSNTSKALLSRPNKMRADAEGMALFPYPVTLTLVHFGFVNVCSFVCASPRLLGGYALTRLGRPSWRRMVQVAQLAFFNVLGSALSSLAISRVPVATVHTIKALSPLFTVVSYTYLFGVTYSVKTYLSLVPLTLGVMMACTGFAFDADDVVGFGAALASTFVFVAQNIYSKKLLRNTPTSSNAMDAASENLDKINILFYSSLCSLTLMVPLSLYYDASSLLFTPSWKPSAAVPYHRGTLVVWWLFWNGLVHFAQNMLAFNVLSLVSPVTYSIASLLKRVFVIVLAIVWFHQSVSQLQWCGIVSTFYGLWLYNQTKTKQEVEKVERKVERKQSDSSYPDAILPLTHTHGAEAAAASTTRVFAQPASTQSVKLGKLGKLGNSGNSGYRGVSTWTYVAPTVGGWNDIPDGMDASKSYIKDPTKSLPSPPDSDKEV